MLLDLAHWLIRFEPRFAVFHYISLRAILAILTAYGASLALGPWLIARLRRAHLGQVVRDDGPQAHLAKSGTPTMGGALILFATISATLLWADWHARYVWVALLTMLGFGLIGAVDDVAKLRKKRSMGLSARQKYLLQSLVGLLAAGFLYHSTTLPQESTLIVPFLKEVAIPLGGWYVVLAYFVIVGTSNAVNLTDGLDGLAIVPAVLVAGGLGVFAYASCHVRFAYYLGIPSLPGAGELAVFCAALVGSGLGFLWFNAHPAQVFMGDVGALALGAALGVVAVMVRQELVLFIMGGLFVAETLSVMVQVVSFRWRGKRVFRMAPLHHHFELSGWPETRVCIRFWIVTGVLVLIGLASLKIR